MSPDEKIQTATESNAEGNENYQRGDTEKAVSCYLETVSLLDQPDQFPQDLKLLFNKLLLSAHLNLSSCFLKLQGYKETITHATVALELSPNNCKALYRRGVAYLQNEDLTQAKTDLLKAAHLEPQNREIRKQLEILKKHAETVKEKEKAAYGELFKKVSFFSEKPNVPSSTTLDINNTPGIETPAADSTIEKGKKLSKTSQAYFDIQIGDGPIKRITFTLYKKDVPKTVENFEQLCIGAGKNAISDPTKPLSYQGSKFHRIIKGFMMQGGDFTRGDGTGGESIYGTKFEDENFKHRHTKRGLLSMANAGPDTNGSQFFITFVPTPHLDGRHVVFGEVSDGFNVLDEVEKVPTNRRDQPSVDITIVSSGVLP